MSEQIWWERFDPVACDMCGAIAVWRHPTAGLRCRYCSRPGEVSPGLCAICANERPCRREELDGRSVLVCVTCSEGHPRDVDYARSHGGAAPGAELRLGTNNGRPSQRRRG